MSHAGLRHAGGGGGPVCGLGRSGNSDPTPRHPPTALAIIGGIKAAFIKHAREDLGLNQEPEE